MPSKFHVKKGDEVVVIAGSAKGGRGVVRLVLPKKDSVVLEAVETAKKKKGKEDEAAAEEPKEKSKLIKPVLRYYKRSQQHPQGRMLWTEGSIHVSNVMLAEKYDARKSPAKA